MGASHFVLGLAVAMLIYLAARSRRCSRASMLVVAVPLPPSPGGPAKDTFHGYRPRHFTQHPYNGLNYQCGGCHPDPARD